jgi:carboxypeptidase Taq
MADLTAFERLRARLFDVVDLHGVAFLLKWDQATYMPTGGAAARARQTALLKTIAHERFVDVEVGRLLERAEREVAHLPADAFEAAYVRVARRDFDRAIATPAAFTRRFFAHTATTYQAWTEARPADDWPRMVPLLETTLDLSRDLSAFEGPGAEHPADPLIARSDHGMTVATLRPLFAALREALVPLVREARERGSVDDAFLRRPTSVDAQVAFARERVAAFGYDLRRGRIDPTAHPFAIEFSVDDVRITIRSRTDDLRETLFTTFHESGHGMYHQGLDPRFEGTPLADGASAGVHESQSRLWENVVGRSHGFWRGAYGDLQAALPDALHDVPLDAFVAAVNAVRPSPIRTAADELTYNLHVIVRFELELALLEGRLAVRDLADAWRAAYAEVLGVDVESDRDGVLQDVHWFSREIGGAFQGYTLGNLLSVQFFEAACRAHPEIPAEIEAGRYGTLYAWTREHVHRHGRVYDPVDLIERVTGGGLDAGPYLAYLRHKFGNTAN